NRENGWIPFVHHAELLEIAAREFKNDLYGLSLAQRVDVRDVDVLSYLRLAFETVEAELRNKPLYSREFSVSFQVELELDGCSGTLTFTAQHPSLAEYRQAAEFRHGFIIMACRHFTGRRIAPLAVHFIHRRRTSLPKFAKFFGCPVKFGQSHEQMIFSRKALATPVTSADSRLLTILHNHAEELLRRRPKKRHNLIQKLERRLIELISPWRGTSQDRCRRAWHE